MRTKGLKSIATDPPRAVLALTAGALLALAGGGLSSAVAAGVPSQPRLPAHFSGLLNDYTSGAMPYEMHGKWTLDLNEARGTASFSAEMTMEFADFANAPDSTGSHDATKLNPHTHHILMTDGVIHNDPTGDSINWMTSCGAALKPPLQGGFVVTGSAYVTANGTNPPTPLINPTPVTICVLGGLSTGAPNSVSVTYSNLSLAFQAVAGVTNASNHFGTQPINGVVVNCESGPGLLALLPSSACRVAVVPEN